MKKFAFMSSCTGEIKIHKCGCRDIKKERLNGEPWIVEAENVEQAIEMEQQSFFEEACGVGLYKDADPEEQENACGFANQDFYIVNCAK